jgi:hypothetical protein
MFVLPFRGEFGIKLLHHICRVHAIEHSHKVIVCEEGDESLYPTAREFLICARNVDEKKRHQPIVDQEFILSFLNREISPLLKPGDSVVWPGFEGPRAYFIPQPYLRVEGDIVPDVVICPRKRAYRSSKNWPHWKLLVEELLSVGIRNIVAAGGPVNSDRQLENVIPCSWTVSRNLDLTLAWMNSCKVVVSTDNGLAHLAVWCGKHLLLISHSDGIIAPGPLTDQNGNLIMPQFRKINLGNFQSENHLKSPIEILLNSWEDPPSIATRVAKLIRDSSATVGLQSTQPTARLGARGIATDTTIGS